LRILNFSYPLSFGAPMFPLEFRGEDSREETRVMGLLCGESCMVLTSTGYEIVCRLSVPFVRLCRWGM